MPGMTEHNEITIAAKTENLETLLEFIEGFSDVLTMKEQMRLSVAAEEIFVNVASYAYAPDTGDVRVRVSADESGVTIEFADSGRPYNPLSHDDPDITLSEEERDVGGLGLLMAKKMTDEISYRYVDGMNVLRIWKRHE
jgi:anti-sigma regulatory factor (Ser/Thr protein kinase)